MANLLMVPLIMGCALVGTASLIKIIKKVRQEQFDQTESAEKRDKKKG